jgi:hypothetical protein
MPRILLSVVAGVSGIMVLSACHHAVDVAECMPDTASDFANLFKLGRTGFYTDGEKGSVTASGAAYTISDKRAAGWLMIGGPGRGRCGTRGPASADTARFRAAAEKYLLESGRRCTILAGDIIADPFWEFQYRCGLRS